MRKDPFHLNKNETIFNKIRVCYREVQIRLMDTNSRQGEGGNGSERINGVRMAVLPPSDDRKNSENVLLLNSGFELTVSGVDHGYTDFVTINS